jgi:hypothetical protein
MRLIYKNVRKFLDFRKNFWINGENWRCPENFFYVTKNNGMSGKNICPLKWYTDRNFFGDGGGGGRQKKFRVKKMFSGKFRTLDTFR